MSLTEREQFFYDVAGFSYDPKTETEDEGRRRCARDLAAAEERLQNGNYIVSVEPDPEPWDGDFPYDGPLWIVTVWGAMSGRPNTLGAVGSVACPSVDDPYIRVVAAELAAEHIPA